MFTGLKQAGVQIKTLRSQFSSIDIFSKLQSSFLEKFFKYNLSDYCKMVSNIYENQFDKKIHRQGQQQQHNSLAKTQKMIASSLFTVEQKFTVQQFQKNVEVFYRERSVSVQKKDLPYAFRIKYNKLNKSQNSIKPGELIFVDVKIKVDVQKIQEFPQKIIKQFQNFRLQKKGKLSKLQQYLSNYKEQSFNVFIIYFGDSNFEIFDKKTYETNTIKLMGNYYKLRIFAFYISKQAMVQTFRNINKIQNLDYINDLVIQFYELKREKQRRRKSKLKQKKDKIKNKQKNIEQIQTFKQKLYMFIGVFGLVGFGFAIKRLLL